MFHTNLLFSVMLNFKNPARHKIHMGLPSVHQDLINHDHRVFLESILIKAIDPEAIQDILHEFAIETTLTIAELAPVTRFSRARVDVVGGIEYVLCPVPQFYNEERDLETGFAIDVDQDHFDVYPFLCNTRTNECKILTRLPHCVVRAIKMDAGNYQEIGDELKEVANEVSAILFISNLYTELEAGMDSPVEFFDDRLFQQLVVKVCQVKDPAWLNMRLIRTRFDQLSKELESSSNDAPFQVERQQRVLSNIAHFLVETIRVIGIDEMLGHVDKKMLVDMAERLMLALVETKDLAIAMELADYMNQISSTNVLKPLYAHLVAFGYYDHVMALERVTGTSFSKDPDIVQQAFSVAMDKGQVGNIPEIEAFFGVAFYADELIVCKACNDLVRKGQIASARDLEFMAGMSCHVDENIALEASRMLLSSGAVDDAMLLEAWTGIRICQDESELRSVLRDLLQAGYIPAAIKLVQWTGTNWQLEPEFVHHIIGMLVHRGNIADARALETASGIAYNLDEKEIHDVYINLFREPGDVLTKLDIAKQLSIWIGVSLPESTITEAFRTLLHAMRDDDRLFEEVKRLAAWTGVMPLGTLVLSECKYYLKNLQFKASSVAMACKLMEWTCVIPPVSLIHETFSTLLATPLASTAVEEAAMLSRTTGLIPHESTIQETYLHILEYRVIDAKTSPVALAKEFQSWTGVNPDERVVKAGMNAAIIRCDVASARAIEAWTGISPDKDVVLAVCKSCYQNPHPDGKWYHDVQELESWTGITVGEDLVHKAYEFLLLQRRLSSEVIETATLLRSYTHIKPHETIISKVRSLLDLEKELGYEREETTKALQSWLQMLAPSSPNADGIRRSEYDLNNEC